MVKIIGVFSAIGGFIGSGFGLGKLVNLMRKFAKVKKILSEAKEAGVEITEAFKEIDELYDTLTDALKDKKLSKAEQDAIILKARAVVKETKEAREAVMEVIALFK